MDERREKAVIRANCCAPAALSRLASLVLGAVLAVGPAQAAVFVVDSVGDQAAQPPTNNGICNSTAGTCTLRAAIQEANGTGGVSIGTSRRPSVAERRRCSQFVRRSRRRMNGSASG